MKLVFLYRSACIYSTDVKECSQKPAVCKNSGTCIEMEGSYSCNCTAGWKGKDCQQGEVFKSVYSTAGSKSLHPISNSSVQQTVRPPFTSSAKLNIISNVYLLDCI